MGRLSDIKFNYLDKIENIDNRIVKYQGIVEDYDKIIMRAEKEDNPNISSVLKSKANYEKKIENMCFVKEYYQEFVDTSDYLMNHLNDSESSQLIVKNDELSNENHLLLERNKELEQVIDEKNYELSRLKHKTLSYEEKIKKRNEKIKDYKIKLDEAKGRLKAKDEAYSSLRDRLSEEKTKTKTVMKTVKIENKKEIKQLASENKRLSVENRQLKDDNRRFECKCQRLEEYCTDLLNRKCGVQNG